jgi:predicted AlkP superfamily phosphohydrolase/phosphomutase
MPQRKVLVIGLDGYEQSVGDKFMAEGALPALAALRRRSARFLLEHGAATRTGLAWEHVSSGQSPEDAGRWSAIHFDRDSYETWHEGTRLPPFPEALQARTVVFDPPYFDLRLAPSVRGVMNWGAHDAGVEFGARPAELADEIHSRFGACPARDCMYEIVWPSRERTRNLGDLLVQALEVRSRAAHWLLKERCPDWDLGFVVVSELHSAIEAFWHGIDSTHPLHALPSAPEAADRLRAVYLATDALVHDLVSAFPDATVVTFAMNGMGPNRSDVASMALLPELLHRAAFHRPLLRVPGSWTNAPQGLPPIDRDRDWTYAVKCQMSSLPGPIDLARRAAIRVIPEGIRSMLRPNGQIPMRGSDGSLRLPLDWMPAFFYQPHWQAMRFFALPSFYDGRIRINLAGREAQGMVSPVDYEKVCDEIESLVRACRDLRTGEPVVDHVQRCGASDPQMLGPSESDLIIVWSGAALGLSHPEWGPIGPLPFRRPGGHSGPYGMAYVAGDNVTAGDYAVRSSFDVVPTIVELLGEQLPAGLSGRSLLSHNQDRCLARGSQS